MLGATGSWFFVVLAGLIALALARSIERGCLLSASGPILNHPAMAAAKSAISELRTGTWVCLTAPSKQTAKVTARSTFRSFAPGVTPFHAVSCFPFACPQGALVGPRWKAAVLWLVALPGLAD
ncbi:MAG: hypothetical protein AAFY03_13390, partial [Pseudomonadota bacterium]